MKKTERGRGLCRVALLLCLLLLPFARAEAKDGSLYLKNRNGNDEGKGWSWDQSTKTLNLYDIEVDDIELPQGSCVNVYGYARVCNAVFSEGSLVLDGPGTLEAYELNAGNGAADRNLVVLNGLYLVSSVTAYDVQIKGGCILAEDEENQTYGVFHLNGTYRQTGGCVRIRNNGSGSGIRSVNNGVWVTAGYLECVTRADGDNASIWCDNGAVCNYGGVIRAVNESSGFALIDSNNKLIINDGVSIFKTNGAQAVLAAPSLAGSMKYWTSASASGKGSGVSGDKGLLAGKSEVIFAKYAYTDEKVYVGDGSFPPTASGIYVYGSSAQLDLNGMPVLSGCYAETVGAGPIPVASAYVSGEGTLVGYSDSVAAVNIQSVRNFTGTLVGVSSKYGVYFDSSGPMDVKLEKGTVIGVGQLCGVVCAKRMSLCGGTLIAAGISEIPGASTIGYNANFGGAELSVEGGHCTLYSSGSMAYGGSGPKLWNGSYCAAYHTENGIVSKPGETDWQREKPAEAVQERTAAGSTESDPDKNGRNDGSKDRDVPTGRILLYAAVFLFGGFCLFLIVGFTVTYLKRRRHYKKKHKKTAGKSPKTK